MALQARFQTFIIFTILKKVSKLFHPKNTSIRPSSLRPLEKNNYLLFQILNETFKEKFIIHNFNVLIILLISILSCSLSSSNERSSLFNIHGFHRSKSERKESKRCLDSRPLFLQRDLQQSGRARLLWANVIAIGTRARITWKNRCWPISRCRYMEFSKTLPFSLTALFGITIFVDNSW